MPPNPSLGPFAHELGWQDAAEAQRRLRELGRRVTHLSRLCWRRADVALARPASRTGRRAPELTGIGSGLALSAGEVVLDRRARPDRAPTPPLRAPAAAAAGPGLLATWETLEETGAVQRLLPEWERVRLLPHASPIHRFTVDRHLVETCLEASALIRRVDRPDLLVVAALLHDIGKGGLLEHSVAGERIARTLLARWGFDDADTEVVAALVRWHLLLPQVATTRDPDDPATAAHVQRSIASASTLDLLAALTEADARATAPQAWTRWRAGLVGSLVEHCRRRMDGPPGPLPAPPQVPVPPALLTATGSARDEAVHVEVQPGEDGTGDGARLTVVARDRVGLLADVAAVLALARVDVRAARAWTQQEWAVQEWQVGPADLDPRLLRQQYAALVGGRLGERTARLTTATGSDGSPTVAVRPEASVRSTVLEVRTTDGRGVLHAVTRALAGLDVTVASAHVHTLGPQAVDVFYLREAGAGALSETRAASVAHAVRVALGG